MSTQPFAQIDSGGAPLLTPLGKRIERLRIERGLSKQLLAHASGTSRQQLWRVMSGKSELTPALCLRLAEVLLIDPGLLNCPDLPLPGGVGDGERAGRDAGKAISMREYLESMERIVHTLRTIPDGSVGFGVKRAVLDALEDAAREQQLLLGAAFFEVRRRVLNGQL